MYEISEEVLKATISYLATRPIQEVDQLFHTLQQLKREDEKPVQEKSNIESKGNNPK